MTADRLLDVCNNGKNYLNILRSVPPFSDALPYSCNKADRVQLADIGHSKPIHKLSLVTA